MATWAEFAAAQPDLARHGLRLLMLQQQQQTDGEANADKAGLAYLATTRADGGPRTHPISPTLHAGRLYAFVLRQSPKLHDLRHNGQYALHSWPYPLSDEFGPEEFFVAGQARVVNEREIVEAIATLCGDPPDTGVVFHLDIERVLYRDRWRAAEGESMYRTWKPA